MKKQISIKYQVMIGIIILFVLTVCVLMYRTAFGKTDAGMGQDTVFLVNGTEIPKEEFQMFLQDEKASTASYFYQQYGAEYGADFWETEFGNEIPIETAKSNALSKLVRVKLEQQLAMEYGLLQSSCFEDIKKELDKEKSIYGVVTEDLFQKYMIYYSKIALETKEKFKYGADPVSEDELMRYYESNKEDKYKPVDDLTVRLIFVKDIAEGKTEEVLNSLNLNMKMNADPAGWKDDYADLCSISIVDKEYGSAEGKDDNSSELEEMIREEAYYLKENEISEPILYGNQYIIAECLERKESEVVEFNEVKSAIEDLLKEELYEQSLSERIEKAEIKVNEKSYMKIQIQ